MRSGREFESSPIFNSGKHAGHTAEWVIFNDPQHIAYLISSESCESHFGDIGLRVRELYRRANHLRIPCDCSFCHSKPTTHIALRVERDLGITKIKFSCTNCPALTDDDFVLDQPSFFVEDALKSPSETRYLISVLKKIYFAPDHKDLTQNDLVHFFETPANSVDW